MERAWRGTLAGGLALAAAAASVLAQSGSLKRSPRVASTRAGSAIADLIRAACKADVVLLPASTFVDADQDGAPSTSEALLRTVAFRADAVVVLQMPGSVLRRTLETGIGLYPAKNAAFPQVSGLTLLADPAEPRGARIRDIRVGSAALDPMRIYSVAVPAPSAEAGSPLGRLWVGLDKGRDPALTIERAIRAGAGQPTGAGGEDRVVFRKP